MTQSTKSWRGGALLGIGFLISLATAALAPSAMAGEKTGAGGKCDLSSECKSNDCEHGVCQRGTGEKVGAGNKCDLNSDCQSDECESGRCQRGRDEKLERGRKCESDRDCKSSNCEHNTCQR